MTTLSRKHYIEFLMCLTRRVHEHERVLENVMSSRFCDTASVVLGMDQYQKSSIYRNGFSNTWYLDNTVRVPCDHITTKYQ